MSSVTSNVASAMSVESSTTPLTPQEEHKRLREMVDYLMNRLEETSVENKHLKSWLSEAVKEISFQKRATECLYEENKKLLVQNDEQLTTIVHLQNELRKVK